MRLNFACPAILVVLMANTLVCGAEPETPAEKQRTEHLQRMKELVGSIRLPGTPGQADSIVPLIERPVFRYADATRRTDESSLWIWSHGGRPSAVLAVEYYPKSVPAPQWLFEIASLATKPIAVEHGDSLRWTATNPGFELTRLDDTAPVDDRAGRRLAQMKGLRDRITASEKATIEGRIELRPLTSPLHRYDASDQGVIDGAIFAFCNGTNPEVLLVLEAQKKSDTPAAWHYGFVQMTGEVATAQLDGKQV